MGQSKRRKKSVDPNSDVICVNISIISDSFVEDPESFYVILRSDDDDVILSPNISTILITSNDGEWSKLLCANKPGLYIQLIYVPSFTSEQGVFKAQVFWSS